VYIEALEGYADVPPARKTVSVDDAEGLGTLPMAPDIFFVGTDKCRASDRSQVTHRLPRAASARSRAASQQPPEQERETPQVPTLVTNVIRVEFVPVSDLIEPLRLFMTEGGVVMPYERMNMLIVTDYSDSVEKILEIVHLLDDSFLDPDYIELIEIQYNLSADVLEDLQKIFGTSDGVTGINFISLDRLNAILVMANSKRALEEVKRWIGRFDEKTGRSIQTFVYRVENSTASNIAMIISLLLGGEAPAGAPTAATAKNRNPVA